MRPEIGGHLFGCDICQEVCPWNKFAQPAKMDELRPRKDYESLSPADILTLSRDDFDELFANSSVQRTGRRGLARNAAVVLGNRQRLESLTVLVKSMREHDEPLVRGHAAWAVAQIAMAHDSAKSEAQRALEDALLVETDANVLEELAISHQSLAR
jgi:epoxyqueuosine reductase